MEHTVEMDQKLERLEWKLPYLHGIIYQLVIGSPGYALMVLERVINCTLFAGPLRPMFYMG